MSEIADEKLFVDILISVMIPYIQNYATLSKLGACCKDESFEKSPTPIAQRSLPLSLSIALSALLRLFHHSVVF